MASPFKDIFAVIGTYQADSSSVMGVTFIFSISIKRPQSDEMKKSISGRRQIVENQI